MKRTIRLTESELRGMINEADSVMPTKESRHDKRFLR